MRKPKVVAELTDFPTGDRLTEVCAWLRSLKLEPGAIAVPVWVEKTQEGQHVLYATEQLFKINPYTGDAITNTVVRKVPANSWPEWMNV